MGKADREVRHLAMVLDGNRRFAKAQGKLPWKGHSAGADKVEQLLDWCKEFGIKELTLYVLSIENLNRDEKELGKLFKLFRKFFKKFRSDKRIKENRIQIKFIGNLSLIPEGIRNLAESIQDETKNNKSYRLNFCLAYSGRQEIASAFNRLKRKRKEITEQDITNSLWLGGEPDLIIRTGGCTRTSNFLPWQSVYSEWHFTKKLWPEFTKQDLQSAVEDFKNRRRNFGR